MLPYINLFGKEVFIYPLIIVIGFAVAIGVACLRAKPFGLVLQDVFNCGLLSFVGAAVGGKIMFILTMLPKIIETPSFFLVCLLSGFTYYGGFLGAIGVILLYLKRYKLPFLKYLDILAPSVFLAQAVGRMGCFCAGCCYGLETTAEWGIMFNDPNTLAPMGVYLVPTQLIEAGGCLILFAALLIYASRRPLEGRVSSAYLISYGVLRFFIEFLRADDRGPVIGLSVSQYISILAVIGGIVLYILAKRISESRNSVQTNTN